MVPGDFVRVMRGRWIGAKGRVKKLTKNNRWIVNVTGGFRISIPEEDLQLIDPADCGVS